ncbi:kinase-like domain-containing protein [Dactylonectria macrodidyma]|uniref:mitogen-activated protein kinase kinase n=1 Tax=Dactylonectria macrodidyma TaxID=307937 RepID=A0A9P9FWD1_9HYPO|nr:kinase-like domain-containing protein [Dactylonectria macrodidyma]
MSPDNVPATPDEASEYRDLSTPASPGSEESSEPSTPLEGPDSPEFPKRVPSLRSVSDPHNMHPNSTALGLLGMARNPVQHSSSFAGSSGATMDNSIMAKARALHQQRLQKGMSPVSPSSPGAQSPPGGLGNGFPANMRMPQNMQRPNPMHPKSAPVVPKQSLSERRAKMAGLGGLGGMNGMGGMGMKLSDMSGSSPSPPTGTGMRRTGAPKLSDITGDKPEPQRPNMPSHGSKMDDFKKYIDTEKGWVTFDGAATITRTGVNFANGQTFKISLDEVEVLAELGKGNYGTVYKVKHAKRRAPRFGQGLGGKPLPVQHNRSDLTPPTPVDESTESSTANEDGTSGVIMAMKEMRLELDDAKFTTILKELVILHECVSPYIIEFYGAFFQEGAVYICIEHMDGGSIDKLYSGGIPENVLRKITYSTVMGLKSLKEEHNIIHRDVKPTNILINTRGQIKICDFGVSGNLVASKAMTNIGCQSYMAPERISGGGFAPAGNSDGSYSVQSDVWSLGLTIIECAKGAYPYPPEVSSTIFSQLSAIVEGEAPSMPDTGYSDSSKDFVKACLHKIPAKRPTYAMLLKHPWLIDFTKPQTITEEAEEGEEADKVAEAVGKINLGSTTEDSEVAEWVLAVMKRQANGLDNGGPSRPALHTAPLDSVSPIGSPLVGDEQVSF